MVFVGSVLQTAASVAEVLDLWEPWTGQDIAEQPGRGQHMQRTAMQNSRTGLFQPRAGTVCHCRHEVGAPSPLPGPWVLGSEQIYCMLSWPKLHEAGQQAGEMTLRGGEGKLLEVPWPQVTASEPRLITSIHSQLVGGVVVKAIKGNENSKHLAKMSPWVKWGILPGRARMRMGLCECRKLANWRGLFYDTFQ